MHALILTLALVIATPALATPEYVLPTLFDVTGVAADDVLNIRARPDADAPVIGTLTPTATGIEVVAEQDGWAQINAHEHAGWVNATYLAYRTDVWEPGALPPSLSCSGTEPFWNLRQANGGVVFSTPEGQRPMIRRSVLDSPGFRSTDRALIAADDKGRLTAVIRPAQCSDGMSGRAYGLGATLIFDGSGQASQMYLGCCRVGH